MHALLNAVSTNRVLERVLPHLSEHTYLVGGCIRDLMLEREPSDFDLVTFGEPLDLAVRIEGILGGRAFPIDRERGIVRIAINHGECTLDISPPRGADIEEDLRERDITINAMALQPAGGVFVDPLRGRSDLREKRIRLIGKKNLLDDPLRGLRCLRFAVQFGFSVEGQTLRLIRDHSETLSQAATERIKHEVLKALAGTGGAAFFPLLHEAGYVRVLFGNAPTTLSMDTAGHAEYLLGNADHILTGVGTHFSEELEHGMPRKAAFRLAAFLFPQTRGRPLDSPDATPERLALSGRARKTIHGTIAGAWRMIDLAGSDRLSGSEMYRVLSDHGGHIPEMLLLAMAAGMVTERKDPGPVGRVCRETWRFYCDRYLSLTAAPLLSGHDILQMPGITPGAVVGRMLRQVEEARADGLIRTRDEALSYLRQRVKR